MIPLDVGEIIRTARIKKGLTQEELGKIVGVQKYAIAKYENGRVVNIKRSKIVKLAQALGLNGSDLIGESAGMHDKIKKDPKAAAAKAAELLSDQNFIELYTLYKSLLQEKKNQICDFILFIANQP